MNQIILGLGSNTPNGKETIEAAIQQLSQFCDTLECSAIYPTPAFNAQHADTPSYVNCVAQGETTLSYDEFILHCKDLEIVLGRTIETRVTNEVPIDIDLICFNKSIIRHKEISAPYLQFGFQQLGIHFLTYPFQD